jgi:S1-C subfamily serine protease
MKRALAVTAALAALAGCGGGTKTVTNVVARTQTTKVEVVRTPGGSAAKVNFDPQAIYRREAPGVVTLFALSGSGGAVGSGFVVDPAGYIVTNAHVVTGNSGARARAVYAQFADGNKLPARIVGTDFDSDIALLKVDPSQLRQNGRLVVLPLGSSSALQVGDPVAAIGSPFNEQQSLSVGVVSALKRDIQSLTDFDIANAIQTDAAINHGNSGGPLLDGSGKVIGVNAQIQSSSGGGEGVGFAVPVETVKRSIAQLRNTGHVNYAYLGVSTVPLYPQLAERLGLGNAQGVLVDTVSSGGPAAAAGIHGAQSHIDFQDERGVPVGSDVIIAVGGHKLTTADALSNVIGAHQPGDRVKVQVLRNGKLRVVMVKLGKRPEKLASGG